MKSDKTYVRMCMHILRNVGISLKTRKQMNREREKK